MKHNRRKMQWTTAKAAKLIIFTLVILGILAAVVFSLRSKVETEFSSNQGDEISSAQVIRGSISTSVSGSGLLSDDDEKKLEIPEGVELESIYVEAGDVIEAGQLLASVVPNSVLTAMMTLSEEMDALDDEINTASVETMNNFISSSVTGRVKEIYIQKGDSVTEVMARHGALMVISLDGHLAADIETDALSPGEAVTVLSSGGFSYPGTVSQVTGGVARVLVTDQGTVCGDKVSVLNAAGETLGSGQLKINDPLKIMGYAGTVDYINVKDNSYVYSGSALLCLRDTDYAVNYESLLKERADMEDELNALISIYREGAIYSTLSGTVKEINAQDAEDRENSSKTNSSSSAATGSTDASGGMMSGMYGSTVSTGSASTGAEDSSGLEYFLISPDVSMSLSLSVDESDILSLAVGQRATVSIDSLEDQLFEGSVTEIDRIGTSSSGVTYYTASVSIPKSSAMLSGMSASATLNIQGVENALMIPVDALNKTASSYYVYTSYDRETGTLSGMTEISVGISNNDYVEVTEGLEEGDTVYYREKENSSIFFSGGMPGGMGGGMPGSMPNMGGAPGMGSGMPGMR